MQALDDRSAGEEPEAHPQMGGDGANSERRVYVETHGCQMNAHDSEKAIALLRPLGFSPIPDAEGADLILLNTCSVREKASEKLFHRIDALRASARDSVVGVLGCVAQSEADHIFERAPAVRLVVGPQALDRLPDLVRQLDDGFSAAIDVSQDNRPAFVELGAEGRQSGAIAFVTIIEGCNKNCSYCIVPFTRGRERSRPAQRILEEMQDLRRAGFNEVHLLGQNVNSYADSTVRPSGREFARNAFPQLLHLVAARSGVPRIKYTTSHPRDFSADIVRVMDEHENLCNWIHLPVQSGSDSVLRRMYRGYTSAEYLEKVDAIRNAHRDYSITSDIIVGFPGETDEEFEATLALVQAVEYDALYTFHYSPRPHTPASALEDSVPYEVKRERFAHLLRVQAEVQKSRYERYLGRVVEVLVDGQAARNHEDASGHTTCNKVVNFPTETVIPIGSLVSVQITEAKRNSLYGKLV